MFWEKNLCITHHSMFFSSRAMREGSVCDGEVIMQMGIQFQMLVTHIMLNGILWS